MHRLFVAMVGLLLMLSTWLVLLACVGAQEKSPARANPHIAPTEALTPDEQLAKFHLPPGFVIQLVAAEPEIQKPMNLAFDAQGKLWTTGSVEYPFPAPDDRPGQDTVRVLSDFAPDGRARKVTTFADGLNIPIGVQPTRLGEAIVYSIPSIYRLTDSDGDGQADRRDVLYTDYGYKDTHGMTGEFTWGIDGWIYCCHGFSNTSDVKSQGEAKIAMTSGNTYRIRPDGSAIEHFTHGQVNPFGLTFDPLGNLYSTDCHTRPIYLLLQGAYYPSFGRPDDGLGFGPEMLQHTHGSTGIAGIATSAAMQFPEEFRDNIFVGNVITNRINRDRLEWHGSSPTAIEMPDFVTCDDPWFRPVDIKLGPDGALYIADFYNRIIGHYEVPLTHPGRDRHRGRIWRVVYQGNAAAPPPPVERDLTKAMVDDLLKDLADPNLTVRTQATQELVLRGDRIAAAVHPICTSGSPTQRAHALWVLERLGKLDEATLMRATQSTEAIVRVHALRVLGERPQITPTERELLLVGLKDRDSQVQRVAIESLGQHPSADMVVPLLKFIQQIPQADSHLLHAARIALRNQLSLPDAWARPLPLLAERESRILADVCPGVVDAAPAKFLLDHLTSYQEPPHDLARYSQYVARYGVDGSADRMLSLVQEKYADDLNAQGVAFKGVQQGLQSAGKQLGPNDLARAQELAHKLLVSGNVNEVQLGIDTAMACKLAGTADDLLAVIRDTKQSEVQRKNAIKALVAVEPRKHLMPLFEILNDPQQRMDVREQIARSLGTTTDPEVRPMMLKTLQTLPAPLQLWLAAGLSSSLEGGEQLLTAVAEGKASARLLQQSPVTFRLRQIRFPNLDERLAKLTVGLPAADQRMLDLLKERNTGFNQAKPDAELGAKVFAKNCAVCHQVANVGAKIGPQLDGIGMRGIDRLMEDVLDPSRNVDQAFRTTTLVLDNGQLVTGLMLREEGEVLVMADAQGKEVRVPSNTVLERSVAQISPMPSNLADLLPEADFYNLVQFLLHQRVKN